MQQNDVMVPLHIVGSGNAEAAKPALDPDKFEPRNGWLLVRKHNPERTAGGLYVPENARDEHSRRFLPTVVRIGQGRRNEQGQTIPLCVKVGDRVLLEPRAQGAQLSDNGSLDFADAEDYALVRDQDIAAVFRG